jgi:tetratricopeptide (TPR) repeat protein
MKRCLLLVTLTLVSAAVRAAESGPERVRNEFSGAPATSERIRNGLDRIEKSGFLNDAVVFFAARVETNPNDPLVRFGYGEALRRVAAKTNRTSDFEKAYEHLDAAMQARPDDRNIRLSAARTAWALYDAELALEALKPLLDSRYAEDDVFDADALRLAATVYLKQRDDAHAEPLLRDLLEHDEADVDTRLKLAELLRLRGDFAGAAEQLGVALRYRNRSPEIYYALGKLYAHQNEAERAVEIYRRARRYDPDNAQARYELANIFLDNDNGRYAVLAVRSALALDKRFESVVEPLKDASTVQAAEILASAVEKTPDNAPLQAFIGKLYLKLGDRERAIKHYELAKRFDPNDLAVRAALANLKMDDTLEAAAELKNIAASVDPGTPLDLSVLVPLAEVYRREQNLEGYAETTQRILEATPADPDREAALGDTLLELAKQAKKNGDAETWKTRLREAAAAYGRAVSLSPQNGEWKYRLATIYDDLGQMKALRLYQEASELDPNNARLFYRWGVFLLNFTMGTTGMIHLYDPEDALKHLERAVQLDPNIGGAHYALAIAYKRKAEHERAVVEFERADALGFSAPEGLLYLGNAYANSGQNERALRVFERVVDLIPDDVEALKDFGFLGLKHGTGATREKALRAVEKAVALLPDDAETLMNYGFALHEQKRSKEAIPYLEKAATLEPESPLIVYNLALALDASGERERALETWKRLVEFDPDGEFADVARERIEYLSRR